MKPGRGEIQPIHVLPEMVYDASTGSTTFRAAQKPSENGSFSNGQEKTENKAKINSDESNKKTEP